MMPTMKVRTLLAVASLMAAPVALASEVDPWESTNRKIFAFNEQVDRVVLKPVAQGYQQLVPTLGRQAVGNVFSNLSEVSSFVNALLQASPEKAATALGRFVFNSTFGLFGLLDVSSTFGLQQQSEDFGQTLAHWGVSSGPYVMLPLLGPATVRDGVASLSVDRMLDPVGQVNPSSHQMGVQVGRAIDTRASLLVAERFIVGDRYAALRAAYLDRRAFEINDGAAAGADDFLSE